MLARAEGCPRASGLGTALKVAQVSHKLIQDLIAAVEKCFTKHGEKWLRANCGGKLAKDESYGFLLADLVLGAIIPRDKAIALGEKLRKENKKIKTKLEQMGRDRAKALKELPPEEQGAEGVRHDLSAPRTSPHPSKENFPSPNPNRQRQAFGSRLARNQSPRLTQSQSRSRSRSQTMKQRQLLQRPRQRQRNVMRRSQRVTQSGRQEVWRGSAPAPLALPHWCDFKT